MQKIQVHLINEIVDKAASILSSEDPVESKIIKLNAIAERSVDINGIGMYTLENIENLLMKNKNLNIKNYLEVIF